MSMLRYKNSQGLKWMWSEELFTENEQLTILQRLKFIVLLTTGFPWASKAESSPNRWRDDASPYV